MQRYRLGRLTGVTIIRANFVLLQMVRHDRRRGWVLHDLFWGGPPTHPSYTPNQLREIFDVQRITQASVNRPLGHVVHLEGLEKTPALASFLTDRYYGDPKDNDERLPGSVYICARDGEFGVTLKEPSQSFMMRIQVTTFKLIVPTLEAVLADTGKSLWETDPYARKPAKRRGKP